MAEYASVSADFESGAITVSFEGGESRVLNTFDLPTDIQRKLTVHGAKAKLVDSYASAKSAVEKGLAGSKAEYALDCVEEMINLLTAGQWSAAREGGPRVSMLAQALARALGIEVAQAAEKLANMTPENKKRAAATPKVARELLALQEEANARKRAALEAQIAEGADTELADLLG